MAIVRTVITLRDWRVRCSIPCRGQNICFLHYAKGGLNSVVGTATRHGLDDPEFEPRCEWEFSDLSRPASRPTQPPVQWVVGFLPEVKNGRGLALTTHTLLAPLAPSLPTGRVTLQFYFYHDAEAGSETYPASYWMTIGRFFPRE
jgi:hypothetical protein